MTWALHNHTPSERPAPPPLELLRLYWLLRSPSGKTLSCGLYRTPAGFEIRAGYGDDDPVRTQFTRDSGTADHIAESWKAVAVATGRFVATEEG